MNSGDGGVLLSEYVKPRHRFARVCKNGNFENRCAFSCEAISDFGVTECRFLIFQIYEKNSFGVGLVGLYLFVAVVRTGFRATPRECRGA